MQLGLTIRSCVGVPQVIVAVCRTFVLFKTLLQLLLQYLNFVLACAVELHAPEDVVQSVKKCATSMGNGELSRELGRSVRPDSLPYL